MKLTIWLAVFGASFSGLALEVVLARAFAISQWNHLSFMVISIALFGFAASGSFLSMPNTLKSWAGNEASAERTVAAGGVLLSASIGVAWIGLIRLPLDYYRLLVEPIQIGYLLAVYLLLILPFFCVGGITAVAYVAYPQKPGSVYFASMAGSALGAIAPAGLLPLTGETGMAALTMLVPLVVSAAARLTGKAGRKSKENTGWTAILSFVLTGFLAFGAGIWMLTPPGKTLLGVRPSEYKSLSQVLQFPDTRVEEVFSGIRGRIERVQSPHLRFAPGLSLKYTEALPPVEAVFTDGELPFFLYDLSSGHAADFARSTLSFSGYELAGRPRKILVIAGGGGLAVPCAMASGADAIRLVQQNPQLADLVRHRYGLEVIRDSPRSYLARTAEKFDVIHLETWGASIPGADALHQEHLLTVASLLDCLEHLTPQGILIVSGRLLLPPAGVLRFWETAREALSKAGAPDPELCIAVLRNWDTFTLLAMRQPIPNPDKLLESARRLNFDVVYLPGADESSANRFNVYDAPYHFREIRRLQDSIAQGEPDTFFTDYVLDVAPQTDLRAFPGRFLKWSRIGELYRTLGSRLHALFLAGEVIVAVVFVEALLASLLLLLLPAALLVKKMRLAPPSGIGYFLGIGSGFMLAELLFVYAGTFFLGDPVISLAVVVTALLLSSGVGGIWAQRCSAGAVRPALLAAGGSVAMAATALGLFSRELLALPESGRYVALALIVMVPGFAMGVPFPLGMRILLHRPVDRTFAWAVNGCASVLASVAAAQMAMSTGVGFVLALAVASYWLAAMPGPGRSICEKM